MKWLGCVINTLAILHVVFLRIEVRSAHNVVEWIVYARNACGPVMLVFLATGIGGLFIFKKHRKAALLTIGTSMLGVLLLFLWADYFRF